MGSLDKNHRNIVRVASKPDGRASAVGIAEVTLERDKGYTRDGGHHKDILRDSPRSRGDKRHWKPLELVMSRERTDPRSCKEGI